MNIKGLLLVSRKPESHDVSMISEWLADDAFIQFLYGSPLDTLMERTNHVHSILNKNATDFSTDICLIAEDRYKKCPIGVIFLNNIHWVHRHCELNVAIGNAAYRKTMVGSELYLLGLMVCFFELNLSKVIGYAYESNDSANRLSQFGGKLDGVLKEHVYKNGAFMDVLSYAINKKQFLTFLNDQQHHLLKKHFKAGVFDWFL